MTAARPSHRVVKTYVQDLHASPDEVFPALCPEREKEWVPGWTATMIHSHSGIAEHGAVFETPHEAGRTRWIVTEYAPPRRIAFVRFQPDGLLVHLELTLGAKHRAGTVLCVCYVYTAVEPSGLHALAKVTDESWLEQMTSWQRNLNEWLARNLSRQPKNS